MKQIPSSFFRQFKVFELRVGADVKRVYDRKRDIDREGQRKRDSVCIYVAWSSSVVGLPDRFPVQYKAGEYLK